MVITRNANLRPIINVPHDGLESWEVRRIEELQRSVGFAVSSIVLAKRRVSEFKEAKRREDASVRRTVVYSTPFSVQRNMLQTSYYMPKINLYSIKSILRDLATSSKNEEVRAEAERAFVHADRILEKLKTKTEREVVVNAKRYL